MNEKSSIEAEERTNVRLRVQLYDTAALGYAIDSAQRADKRDSVSGGISMKFWNLICLSECTDEEVRQLARLKD